MNKYNNKTIYIGDLIINKDGKRELFKEKNLFIYDENKDVFYSYLETFNLFLSRDLEKLSKQDLEQIQRIIDENTYSYIDNSIDGQVYIEQSSIELFLERKNYKK